MKSQFLHEEDIAAKIEEVKSGRYHQFRDRRRYRIKGNIVLKCCRACKEFKPVRDFYWTAHRRTWMHYCKTCHNKKTSSNRFGTSEGRGLIPWARVKPFFIELVNRVGRAEAGRRIGVNKSAITAYSDYPPTKVQRRTAKRIFEACVDARSRNEVRHRLSIQHGTLARGKGERPILDSSQDIYRKHGDIDSERKRQKRSKEV